MALGVLCFQAAGCSFDNQSGRHSVPSGKAPWIVFILAPQAGHAYLCSGSIISPRWILTAAHCATYQRPLVVDRSGRLMRVKQTIVYPSSAGVDWESLSPHSKTPVDLALLEMPTDIPGAKVIKLPASGALPIPTDGTLWGYGPGDGKVGQLHWSESKLSACKEGGAFLVCMGDKHGRFQGCQGDSGGPVTAYDPATRRETIWAVNSFGAINPLTSCNVNGLKGLYGVDIRPRLEWIKAVAGLN